MNPDPQMHLGARWQLAEKRWGRLRRSEPRAPCGNEKKRGPTTLGPFRLRNACCRRLCRGRLGTSEYRGHAPPRRGAAVDLRLFTNAS